MQRITIGLIFKMTPELYKVARERERYRKRERGRGVFVLPFSYINIKFRGLT